MKTKLAVFLTICCLFGFPVFAGWDYSAALISDTNIAYNRQDTATYNASVEIFDISSGSTTVVDTGVTRCTDYVDMSDPSCSGSGDPDSACDEVSYSIGDLDGGNLVFTKRTNPRCCNLMSGYTDPYDPSTTYTASSYTNCGSTAIDEVLLYSISSRTTTSIVSGTGISLGTFLDVGEDAVCWRNSADTQSVDCYTISTGTTATYDLGGTIGGINVTNMGISALTYDSATRAYSAGFSYAPWTWGLPLDPPALVTVSTAGTSTADFSGFSMASLPTPKSSIMAWYTSPATAGNTVSVWEDSTNPSLSKMWSVPLNAGDNVYAVMPSFRPKTTKRGIRTEVPMLAMIKKYSIYGSGWYWDVVLHDIGLGKSRTLLSDATTKGNLGLSPSHVVYTTSNSDGTESLYYIDIRTSTATLVP